MYFTGFRLVYATMTFHYCLQIDLLACPYFCQQDSENMLVMDMMFQNSLSHRSGPCLTFDPWVTFWPLVIPYPYLVSLSYIWWLLFQYCWQTNILECPFFSWRCTIMDTMFNLCWQQAGHVYLGDLLTPIQFLPLNAVVIDQCLQTDLLACPFSSRLYKNTL